MPTSSDPPGRSLRAAAALLALAGLAAWLIAGGGRSLRAVLEGPEAGIRRALAVPPPSAAAPLAGGGLPVKLETLRFADLIVTGAGGDRADVVAVADVAGTVEWRGSPVRLAYLGRERLAMVRCPAEGWCAEGGRLPRLGALLGVLAERARAFDDADAGAYRPLVADDYRGEEGGKAELLRRLASDLGGKPRARLRPLAWQIRIERETAQVGEDYELALGAGPARKLRARLDLRDEGGRWRFTGGL